MRDLRILVTGRTERDLLSSLQRAVLAVTTNGEDLDAVDIVLISHTDLRRGGRLAAAVTDEPRVRVHIDRRIGDLHMLDVGLYVRPLPAAVAVLGDRSSWALDAALAMPTLIDAGVGAVVPYGTCVEDVALLLRHGAVFAAGPLCAAGGFAGDGVRSILDRLGGLGYATVELAPTTTATPSTVPAVPTPLAISAGS